MKDITPSLEILLNMANSHQNHVVGLNIPVVITRQGDILELGLDGCCMLLIHAEQSQPR